MKINHVPKNIKILALGFFFIFLGFNGAQQYVTTFFSAKGNPEIGFQSLILLYLCFVIANPLAVMILNKYGARIAVVIAPVVYGLYISSTHRFATRMILVAKILLSV